MGRIQKIQDMIEVSCEGIEVEAAYIEAVRCAAVKVLEFENARGRFPSIILTDDETIHRCNLEYRSVDRPTDVLSFPADEGDSLYSPPDGFLGDIMISVPTAERQGRELGHSTAREIAFLTVHGMLHLLGYDHIDPEDERVMLARQRLIIAEVEPGLGNSNPFESEKTMCNFDENRINEMIELAVSAKQRAYVPYSHFHVGACLLGRDGKYYLGCNIENAAYSPTNCAERTALFKAVSEGMTEFAALAIVSDSKTYTFPCGVCRQVLAEFCDRSMPVICANCEGEYCVCTLGELLPHAFTKEDMEA